MASHLQKHASAHHGGADPVTPAGIGAQATSLKDAANGYAGLDADSLINSSQIPAHTHAGGDVSSAVGDGIYPNALLIGGSRAMTGDFNMGAKAIGNIGSGTAGYADLFAGVARVVRLGKAGVPTHVTTAGDVYAGGAFEVAGAAHLESGAYFGGAELIVGASNVLHLGASGGTPGSATNSGDVYIRQQLEVGSTARFNGYVLFDRIPGNVTWAIGGGGVEYFGGTVVTDDGIHLFPEGINGRDNNNIMFTAYSSRAIDHDHDVFSVNPTVFFHSATSPEDDNRQYGYIVHNQASFDFTCGLGYHYFPLDALVANATITFTANPTTDSGVVFTINTTTLTGRTSGAGAGEFNFGVTLTLTLDAIVSAINAAETGVITCHKVGTTMIVFEVDVTGTAGNAYVTTETTDTDGVYSFGGAVFSSGRAAVTGVPQIAGTNTCIPGQLETGPLYVRHSALGAGDYVSIYHDTANGYVVSGSGRLYFNGTSVSVDNAGQLIAWGGGGLLTQKIHSNATLLQIRMDGLSDASNTELRLRAANSSVTTNEPGAMGAVVGWNSADTSLFGAFMVVAPVDVDLNKYAAAFTAQADPVFAVFSHQDPDSGVTKHIAFKHDDTDGQIITGAGDLRLSPATGIVRFGTKTGTGDVVVDGHVTIKDSAGNTVKLATVA